MYNEVWIVGHKGDHLRNLQDLGIVKKEIDLAHVLCTLGVKARKLFIAEGKSYKNIITNLNPEIKEDLYRIKYENKKVLVLMPFPNLKLEDFLDELGLRHDVDLIVPIIDYQSFISIENKIVFSRFLEDVIGKKYKRNIIPWTIIKPTWGLQDVYKGLGVDSSSSLFFQKAWSIGGNGTIRISSKNDFEMIKSRNNWGVEINDGQVKVSKAIENAYPTNGTGCIIPTANGDCKVLVDPLSHKPVNLESMGVRGFVSAGNDWSEVFPYELQKQYVEMVVSLGQFLFHKFGYTGIFGPDGLVSKDEATGEYRYHIHEINPRWQGTTPYQTLNALKNNRLPLEFIHYMVKFAGNNKQEINFVNELVGDEHEYNAGSIKEKGGFYLKINVEKKALVTHDVNGFWGWNGEDIRKIEHSEEINAHCVYTRNCKNLNKYLLPGETPLWLKGPMKGETVGEEFIPVGYIMGSGVKVFESDSPQVTDEGKILYSKVTQLMFNNLSH